jgi:pseudaminic acid cytidylyltransferase
VRLAVIPARGGSKRIPRKNIKLFAGRPMLAWAIDNAQQSGCFDAIAVSTEDAEIAAVALACGASVIQRPAELADDTASTAQVMSHAIEASTGAEFVCCLYATTPLLEPQDLQSGLELLQTSGADYVMAAAPLPAPAQQAFAFQDDGRVRILWHEHMQKRTQDLPPTYYDAGQFYWARAATWLAGKPIFGYHTRAVLLPARRAIDIDTLEDWEHAEAMVDAKTPAG